jgi:hypothetical protein
MHELRDDLSVVSEEARQRCVRSTSSDNPSSPYDFLLVPDDLHVHDNPQGPDDPEAPDVMCLANGI